MLLKCPRLPGGGDCRSFLLMSQVKVDFLDALFFGMVHGDFRIRGKQRVQVVFVVGQEQRADPGGLVQPHIVRVVLGSVDMQVQTDLRIPEGLIHRQAPGVPVAACFEGRIGGQMLRAISPEVDWLGLSDGFQKTHPLRVGRRKPADERNIHRVCPGQPPQHLRLEADPEIFAFQAVFAKPLHEVRERRQHEVVVAKIRAGVSG